eukprot:365576-Chlamydomonas_euryale.AAC.2
MAHAAAPRSNSKRPAPRPNSNLPATRRWLRPPLKWFNPRTAVAAVALLAAVAAAAPLPVQVTPSVTLLGEFDWVPYPDGDGSTSRCGSCQLCGKADARQAGCGRLAGGGGACRTWPTREVAVPGVVSALGGAPSEVLPLRSSLGGAPAVRGGAPSEGLLRRGESVLAHVSRQHVGSGDLEDRRKGVTVRRQSCLVQAAGCTSVQWHHSNRLHQTAQQIATGW